MKSDDTMKEIIYNYDLLSEEVINQEILRAKILIINSNDKILFEYENGNYQLPGGHVEPGETFIDCLKRELKEEIGIEFDFKKITPFLIIKYLCKDYPTSGINSKYISNYYYLKTDFKPDYSKIKLTENEKKGKFELKYIDKSKALKILEESLKSCTRKGTVIDTIEAVKEYLRIND